MSNTYNGYQPLSLDSSMSNIYDLYQPASLQQMLSYSSYQPITVESKSLDSRLLPIPAQQLLNLRGLPNTEIKETVVQGSNIFSFFVRRADNLQGILIQGNVAKDPLVLPTMQHLTQKYGSIHVIEALPEFDFLKEVFLSQTIGEGISHPSALSLSLPFNPYSAQPDTQKAGRQRMIPLAGLAARTEMTSLEIKNFILNITLDELFERLLNLNDLEGNVDKKVFDDWKKSLIKGMRDGTLFDGATRIPWIEGNRSWSGPEGFYIGGAKGENLGHIKLSQDDCYLLNRTFKYARMKKELQFTYEFVNKKSNIQGQHSQWDPCFAHLEEISLHFGTPTTTKIIRGSYLGNKLIENIRLFKLNIEMFQKFAKKGDLFKDIIRLGMPLATLQPTLACVAIVANIVALLRSTEEQVVTALSHQTFIHALNNCVLPMIQSGYQMLAENQERLKLQTDQQSSDLLKAMNQCQEELIQWFNVQGKENKQRFDNLAFNDFVRKAQSELNKYLMTLIKAKTFIVTDSFSTHSWLDEYLAVTSELLNQSKTNSAHGYNGKTAMYPLECVVENPIYCSGMLHQIIFENQKFPPELTFLYTATHTFIGVVHSIIQKGCVLLGSKQPILNLAKELNEGIVHNLAIFRDWEKKLKSLSDNHRKFLSYLKKFRESVFKKKEDAEVQTISALERKQENICQNVVGSEMFGFSSWIASNLKLKSHAKSIRIKLLTRDYYLGVASMLRFEETWTEQALKVTNIIAKKNVRDLTQLKPDLERKTTWLDRYAYPDAQLVREIVWNRQSKKFESSVSVSALAHFSFPPFHRLTQVTVSKELTLPKNPLFHCTVTYYNKNGEFEVAFNNSRLKKEDIQGIPDVDSARVAKINRRKMMEDVLALLTGGEILETNSLKDLVGHFEMCTPLVEGDELVPLPLPKVLMRLMRYVLCPDFEKLTLAGVLCDLKYDFKKVEGSYQLLLHALYGNKSYISRCVFEVDAQTVESYCKPMDEEFKPNLTEFLYSALFSGYYPGEGLPGSKSYFNAERKIIAPALTSFPGLFAIWENFPYYCFNFNHHQYDLSMSESLNEALNLRSFSDQKCVQLFSEGKIFVDQENYIPTQHMIRSKLESLKTSTEYREFKQNYTQFVSLMAFVSSIEAKELQSLMEDHLGIIAPDALGSLEQALFDFPLNNNAPKFLQIIQDHPSLALQHLKKYHGSLEKIIASKLEISTNKEEILGALVFQDKSFKEKPTAHLEEDLKYSKK